MIIWGCKVYVVNSKYGKKYLDPRTSTNTRTVVGPMSTDNLPHQADGYFMGDPNIIYLLLYYDPHIDIVKIIHYAYVDEHEIWIHPTEPFKPGSPLIHEYPNGKYAPVLAAPSKIKLVKYNINIINYPFDPGQILSISIELPTIGKYLSISIMDDSTLNSSYISQV